MNMVAAIIGLLMLVVVFKIAKGLIKLLLIIVIIVLVAGAIGFSDNEEFTGNKEITDSV